MKPSIPKGTRDFGPEVTIRRKYIFNTIEKVFQRFGYRPIETPAMENLSTLTGKYGDEGDKLLFKVLDSGDYFAEPQEKIAKNIHKLDYLNRLLSKLLYNVFNEVKWQTEKLHNDYTVQSLLRSELAKYSGNLFGFKLTVSEYNRLSQLVAAFIDDIASNCASALQFQWKTGPDESEFEKFFDYFKYIYINEKLFPKILADDLSPNVLTRLISEKGLRYDLTVPFARYVVMHRNDITFPFKRYQIQPVWRADRPQKGRYREFYQCDADVIGSDSLLNEAELVQMVDLGFRELKLSVNIKINNRKILAAMAEAIGAADKLIPLTVAIDKLDKIGTAGVKQELEAQGIDANQWERFAGLLVDEPLTAEVIHRLESQLGTIEIGRKGLDELTALLNFLKPLAVQNKVTLDTSLARGLSYYTGTIFEVKVNEPESQFTSSICGGGRYDNLTGIFGLDDVSGVGISFGADRIYDVLEELKRFPDTVSASTQVLFCCMDENAIPYALPLLTNTRTAGIAAEVYPAAAKLKKQLDYADSLHIPYCVIIGSNEMQSGQLVLKDMRSGTQQSLPFESILNTLQASI